MSDSVEPKPPEIPDELYGLWEGEMPMGWNGSTDGELVCAYTSRSAAEADNPLVTGGVYGTVELLGVNPARLAAAEAEVERLKSQMEDRLQGARGLLRWLLFALLKGKGEISVSREDFDASSAFVATFDGWDQVDHIDGQAKGATFRLEAVP
jgi:hypothetical protein